MKKTILALLIGSLALSGCSWLHSDTAWKSAKQENPLEIPPNMNRPNVSNALRIPTVNAQQTQQTQPAQPAQASATPGVLHLKGDVESVYKQVGQALGSGTVGSIASQNDNEHTYQVAMAPKMQLNDSKGFLARHFSNTKQPDAAQGGGALAPSGQATGPKVLVQVKAASGGGSNVSATGDPQQVTRLMNVLKARLGG